MEGLAQFILQVTCASIIIYLFIFERKRESPSSGGAEREGDTESEAGSRL